MTLNSDEILEEGIVIPNGFGKKAQISVDLSLSRVTQINSNASIAVDNKENYIPPYNEIEPDFYENATFKGEGWYLQPGVYSLTFNEGCKFSVNRWGRVLHRSTLQRSGSIIVSSPFDPGFECSNIGTTLFVMLPIFIEVNARVAQMVVYTCHKAEAYNGQYQGDKDRK